MFRVVKYITYIFLLVSCLPIVAQHNSLYESLTLKNFEKHKAFHVELDTATLDLQLLNVAIFFYTNQQRVKHRRSELTHSPHLEEMAIMHSVDMVEYDFFDHINRKVRSKKTPDDRAKLVGITNPYLAENIVEAYMLQYTPQTKVSVIAPGRFRYKNGTEIPPHTYLSLAEEIVDMWMNSPNHRDNILSKDALQLGCGTSFFINNAFNEMPSIFATQNFQLYRPLDTSAKKEQP